MVSKLSGFFQMTANFPDDFKTVRIFQMTANFPDDFKTIRIFPDDCQFSGWFQNCPDFPDDCQFSGLFQNYLDFSRWLPIFRMISKLFRFSRCLPIFGVFQNCPEFSRWLPIFRIISKMSNHCGYFLFPDLSFRQITTIWTQYLLFLLFFAQHVSTLWPWSLTVWIFQMTANFPDYFKIPQKKLLGQQVVLVQKALFHIFQPFLVHFMTFLVYF